MGWNTTVVIASILLLAACYRPPVDRVCTFEDNPGASVLLAFPRVRGDGTVRTVDDCPDRARGGGYCPCCDAVIGGTDRRACDIPDVEAAKCSRCIAAREGRDGGDDGECVSVQLVANDEAIEWE